MRTLVILGACGTSREAWWIVQENWPGTPVVFVDDVSGISEVSKPGCRVPVVQDWDFREVRRKHADGAADAFTEFICGMGSPAVKRVMVAKALEHGLRPAPSVVCAASCVRPGVRVGVGGIIHHDTVLTTDVTVGDFVTVQGPRIGHDVVLGDYTTVTVGVHIGGHAVVGEGVHIGMGASIRERVVIAPWVKIGMNAAVVGDVTEPGITVAGVPARPLCPRERPPRP